MPRGNGVHGGNQAGARAPSGGLAVAGSVAAGVGVGGGGVAATGGDTTAGAVRARPWIESTTTAGFSHNFDCKKKGI